MSRILMLGGTGAMGVYLREILAERGFEVFVTSRQKQVDVNNVKFLCGNAQDDTFLRDALATVKPDVLVDFLIYSTKRFSERHNLLLNSVSQYVFLSSYRVFADDVPLTERSPRLLDASNDAQYLSTDEYALRKAREENILRDSRQTNWTIIRPGITYSKERFQFGCLEANVICARALAGVPVVMPDEMMAKRTTMTWGRDVARMIAGLVQNEGALSEDFNCASHENHTWREVAEIYRRFIGMEVRSCTMDEYINLIGSPYQPLYDRMFDRVLDNSKVLATTGLDRDSLTSLEDGLGGELTRFCKHPKYRCMDFARQAKIDRLTGTRFPLRGFGLTAKKKYFMAYWPGLSSCFPMRCARIIRRFAGGLRR